MVPYAQFVVTELVFVMIAYWMQFDSCVRMQVGLLVFGMCVHALTKTRIDTIQICLPMIIVVLSEMAENPLMVVGFSLLRCRVYFQTELKKIKPQCLTSAILILDFFCFAHVVLFERDTGSVIIYLLRSLFHFTCVMILVPDARPYWTFVLILATIFTNLSIILLHCVLLMQNYGNWSFLFVIWSVVSGFYINGWIGLTSCIVLHLLWDLTFLTSDPLFVNAVVFCNKIIKHVRS